MLRAANKVCPFYSGAMIELEAPVRRNAFRCGMPFRLALVNRRQPASKQHLTAKLELLRRLVASVDAAGRFQLLEFLLVKGEALRLAKDGIGDEAQPVEIADN